MVYTRVCHIALVFGAKKPSSNCILQYFHVFCVCKQAQAAADVGISSTHMCPFAHSGKQKKYKRLELLNYYFGYILNIYNLKKKCQ